MLPEILEDPYVEVALQAPPSPDYIPGPEEPEQAPPSPDYVPGPEYADDEISDFEAHRENDDDEDPEEDPVDYLVDGGDDGDDKEGSSEDDKDDEDDDMDIEADEEEEEEKHPAPADSVVVASTSVDQAPSAEKTEPFETDESAATPPPHPACRMIARISIPAPVPMPAWSDSEIVRLLAISSPPASPLSPWSSPPPHIPFPPVPPILSPPLPVLSPEPPPSPIRSLGYRATMIRLRAEAASTSHSPPLQLPSARESSSAAARPTGGLKVDYSFVATIDREIMHDPEREVAYGITDSLDEIVETLQRAPISTDTELGGYMREFETRVRQDTDEIYMRRAHAYTRHLMETEAKMSREAWVRSTDASDLVCGEVMSLRTTILGQMKKIRKLQAADRRRQTVISELLRTYHRRSTEIIEDSKDSLEVLHSQSYQRRLVAVHRFDHVMTSHFILYQPTKYYGFYPGYNCAVENQVKFAICTLHSVSLTWWNTHVKTVGHEAAYGMSWKTLIKMMTEKYCPRNEIMKLEMKLWDLKVKGLPDMIHGSVVASKPKTMQEAVEIATELMDKKIRTFAERETASKRNFENTSRNTPNQQQQSNKRQNTGRVYTAASSEKKQYGGSKPLCAKCQKTACYECGVQGHFKREYPKLKNNNNHGNQGGRNNAPARVYAAGHAGTDPDANLMTGTFLLNNRYASVLFDTSADRSFVSTTFSTQINITPSTLDHYYDVELADGGIIGFNTILRGCTLNLLNHPFNIDLMPVKLGSFDAIIGMDSLAKYQAVIVCDEKIVRIPWGNETLIIHGDSINQGNATRLSIISCTKTKKYAMKGFPIFLAHITTKEVEDKSKKKRLEDVHIV
uniref:CCHC-type domain-containing protein n=1 Tax=Tanacetum cinerariifolium TaxID=118510 RepID=A0A699IN89_TANCI|nr:hypothetical protein [Tanacetum cinerariifolium]